MVDFIKYVGAILLFLAFIWGGVAILQDNVTEGNINVSGTVQTDLQNKTDILTKITNQYEESYNTTRDMEERLLETDEGEDLSGFDYLITGGYSALTTIRSTFSITNTIFTDIQKTLNIPPFLINIFVVMLLITIVISIVYMVFRFQPRSD